MAGEMSLTTKCRATEEDVQLISSTKKRKVYSEIDQNACSGEVEVTENTMSPAASRTSSDCFKHYDESSNVVKSSLESPDLENVDLQSESFETEISTSIERVFSREATPTSCGLYGDSSEIVMLVHSSKKKPLTPPAVISRRKIPAENMPSPVELEEFFATAEKYDQKRFAEKYNYDIVKDVPLEGKYQWVRLQP